MFLVVDLALNQAAQPWFHQYLDPQVPSSVFFLFPNMFFLGPHICNLDDLASYPKDPGWKHQLQPEINLELEKQTGKFYT